MILARCDTAHQCFPVSGHEFDFHAEILCQFGHHIDVVCNIANPEDAKLVLENGGEGVGLLRTEFLFESSAAEPTLEEQCESLKAIARELGNRQLIVRTADIGGDKLLQGRGEAESNPFLGVRGASQRESPNG